MHLLNMSSSTGRLKQFRPTLNPKTKKQQSLWNRDSSRSSRFFTTKLSSVSKGETRPKSSSPRRKAVHFATLPPPVEQIVQESADALLLENKPSLIYRFNSIHFLNSLRNFRQQATAVHQSDLSRHYKMSKEIMDNFVRLKSAQIDTIFGDRVVNRVNGLHSLVEGSGTNLDSAMTGVELNSKSSANSQVPITEPVTSALTDSPKKSVNKTNTSSPNKSKNVIRPKSASSRRAKSLANGLMSRSASKLNNLEIGSDEDQDSEHENGFIENDEIESLEPIFHRSLDKISSIANWEKQIRYELEIEKELQCRELDRQREKMQHDRRKLEEWDKQLRIELDARERKIRLNEEELRSRLEEFSQKSAELTRREQMINEIVAERIKAEMKFEIDKLRKKFNELELDKNNLSKKEERVKEVEARLHEQVKIVKEKIDSKRLTDIEMAKYKKELEIIRKENEVLKEKVDSMEDYQVTKFENRSLRSELQILKETLDTKNAEMERDRERWEKEQRTTDQKIVTLKGELRRTEQELVIQKQKAQGDFDEMSSKYEAVNGQLKRLQAFIKDHLAKLNADFSSTTQTLNNSLSPPLAMNGSAHLHRHVSTQHLHRLNRLTHGNRPVHQRSVSMDGHDYISPRSTKGGWQALHRSPARGCYLCDDDVSQCQSEDVLDENVFQNSHRRNSALMNCDDIEEEVDCHKGFTNEPAKVIRNSVEENSPANDRANSQQQTEEVVQRIMNKIYQQMSQVTIANDTNTTVNICQPQAQTKLNENRFIAQLIASIDQPESSIDKSKSQQTLVNSIEMMMTSSEQKSKNNLIISREDDFDSDELDNLDIMANNRAQVEGGNQSLYEELLASETATSKDHLTLLTTNETNLQHSASNIGGMIPKVPFTSSPRSMTSASAIGTAVSWSSGTIQNDDNNNHVRQTSGKQPPLATASRTTSVVVNPLMSINMVAATTSGSAHNNSGGESSTKSESFEADW